MTAVLHISLYALYFNVYILYSFYEDLERKLKTDEFLHISLTPERKKTTIKQIYIFNLKYVDDILRYHSYFQKYSFNSHKKT